MYHFVEYRSDPEERKLVDYTEMLIIPIEKDRKIQIKESVILREIYPYNQSGEYQGGE
jgi:hypothetical protein